MRLKILFLLVLTITLSIKINAQTTVKRAQAIYIYNFLSHIQWPDTDIGNKYTIGVYGNTETYGYLKSFTKNRKVGNKYIEIVQIKTPVEAKKCNVLLIAINKSDQIASIRNILNNNSCLIIGEKSGTIKYGAVVDFHIAANKLRYKIDNNNAKEQNLLVSKPLLNMSL